MARASSRADLGPARWLLLALALVAAGCTARAQTPTLEDAGPPNVLQNTLGLYGVQLPSADAGTTPPSCHPYGDSCSAPMECCSRQCTNGRCGDGAVSCRPPGSSCGLPSDCCSRFCEQGVCQ